MTKPKSAQPQEGNELAQVQQTPALTPDQMISQAMLSGVPVDTLERLMTLRDKMKAERAKEAYYAALSKFQSECPEIEKKKAGAKTNTGKVAYYYAPLDDIVKQTKKILEKNGFSYSFQTDITETKVTVVCEAQHKEGHQESSQLTSPMSTRTQVMSAPQQIAATVTYLKRYAFCNVFGIMTADEDIDGKDLDQGQPGTQQPGRDTPPPKKHTVTDFQKKKIFALLTDLGSDHDEAKEKIKKAFKLGSFNDLGIQEASKVIEQLMRRVKTMESEEAAAGPQEKEDPAPFTKISCYQCGTKVEKKDAYKDWFCSKEHQEQWVEKNYGKKKNPPWESSQASSEDIPLPTENNHES